MRETISLSLRDIVEPLFKYKKTMLICMLSIAVPIVVYSTVSYFAFALYEASSKVMVEQKNTSQLLNFTAMAGYNLLDTEIEILQSKPVIESVLQKLNLTDLKPDDVEGIIDGLSIVPIPNTNILRISLRHKDKNLIAPFVNTLTDEYIRQRFLINKDIASVANRFFVQEIDKIAKEIAQMREQLHAIKNKANLISVPDQKQIYLRNLESLSSRRTELSIKTQILNDKKENIRKELNKEDDLDVAPFLDTIPSGISTLESMLLELELKKHEMVNKFNKNDREVKSVSTQIYRLKSELHKKKKQHLSDELRRVELEIGEVQLEMEALSTQIDAYAAKIKTIEEISGIVGEYNQNIKELEERKGNLMKSSFRVREMVDIEQQGSISIYRVEDAVVPEDPVYPRPLLFSVIGIITGFFFGIITVSVIRYFDHSIQSTSDISQLIELPPLTTFFETARKEGPPNPMVWKEDIEFQKGCRRVQTVLNTYHDNSVSKSMVFIGAKKGEGATTIASNMATYLANAYHHSVLLIDCNMENPCLHTVFHTSNETGLPDILSNKISSAEALKMTEIENVSLIPTRKGIQSIDIDAVQEIIDHHKNEFDHIIFDCPPSLTVPDAYNICRASDEIFYIIESEKTRHEIVLYAKESFTREGIQINHIILNKKKRYIPDVIYRML